MSPSPNAEEISENSAAHSEVLNKYQAAAEIANKALALAISLIRPDATVYSICTQVEAEIKEQASQIFTKKKGMLKGVAFPCAVSVNNVLCYNAPVVADSEGDVALRQGDVVKVELGVHVDGFPVLVGTTVVCGETLVSGPAANLLQAAHLAAEAAARLIRPGNRSSQVVAALKQIAKEFDVRFVQGMISHQIGKDRLADEKMVVVNPAEHQLRAIEDCTFDEYEAFVVDIALSTSEDGRVRSSETIKTSIYKRTEESYNLKLKASRAIYSDIQNRFGAMAFNLREVASSEGATRARLALSECTQHGVVTSYDVLEDRSASALTARIMFTVILMPSGSLKITDYQWKPESVKPTVELQSAQLRELLATPLRPAKKDKK